MTAINQSIERHHRLISGKLERATDACPIKHSLDATINFSVIFECPEQRQ